MSRILFIFLNKQITADLFNNMSKKITIKEEDVDQPYEEIIEQRFRYIPDKIISEEKGRIVAAKKLNRKS